jgi:hypothetical protein
LLLHFPISGEGESVTSQNVASSVIWALYGIMFYSALAAQGVSPLKSRVSILPSLSAMIIALLSMLLVLLGFGAYLAGAMSKC